jgi:hypothetical protein
MSAVQGNEDSQRKLRTLGGFVKPEEEVSTIESNICRVFLCVSCGKYLGWCAGPSVCVCVCVHVYGDLVCIYGVCMCVIRVCMLQFKHRSSAHVCMCVLLFVSWKSFVCLCGL